MPLGFSDETDAGWCSYGDREATAVNGGVNVPDRGSLGFLWVCTCKGKAWEAVRLTHGRRGSRVSRWKFRRCGGSDGGRKGLGDGDPGLHGLVPGGVEEADGAGFPFPCVLGFGGD